MTAPSSPSDTLTADRLTSDRLKAEVLPYTNARIALATAVLGSVGASLMWLGYLAIAARDVKLVATVAVGMAIGFAGEWLQHYVRGAIRERRSETSGDPPKNRSTVALLWASGFGLAALASEHLIGEMIYTYLVSFLGSLLSLVPAGAIIGWSMNRGRSKDENLFQLIATGLSIGLSIAVVTGILWTIAFGHAPWWDLVSWWCLIGLGTRFVTRHDRNAVTIADPIAAVVIVFVATFLLNLLPRTYDKLGVFKTIPEFLRVTAAEIQTSPGLPGPFSLDQEKRIATGLAKASKARDDSIARVVADEARKDSIRTATDTARARIMRGLPSAHSTVTPGNLRRAAEEPSADSSRFAGAIAVWKSPARREYICSWLIILAFAVGAGLAPGVERALRPVDYPNSETFRRDVRLTMFMVFVLAAACAVGRLA